MRRLSPRVRALTALFTLAVAALSSPVPARAQAAGVCDAASAALPARPAGAPDATRFVHDIAGLDDDAREAAIRAQLLAGNVPSFLRRLVPVRVQGANAEVTLCVAPDYLAIGSDSDYLLVPMRLATALDVADRYGFVLPTRKMVDAIYAQSSIRLAPQPLPAGDTMRSTAYYWRHNELVLRQRSAFGAVPAALTAGDKKDLVLTNRLWRNPDRVAIYGWHRSDGRAIQPLSTVHGERYADYSHGVRLVGRLAWIDGEPRPVTALLGDPRLAAALSDEGVIPRVGELIAQLEARGAALRLAPRATLPGFRLSATAP
ncbi:hypothetical protein [Solimonas variicoloris]|uniref:hypothetical protein n=1 Tax=Solimonas variicoloris TaxID=254408 RepID=UPI000364F7DC|nr:hypothetical protein [Solimonas variicoloris]